MSFNIRRFVFLLKVNIYPEQKKCKLVYYFVSENCDFYNCLWKSSIASE